MLHIKNVPGPTCSDLFFSPQRFGTRVLFRANQCGQMGAYTPKASVSSHFQSASRCLLPIAHINQSRALFTAKLLIVREGIKWYLGTSIDAEQIFSGVKAEKRRVLVQLLAHLANALPDTRRECVSSNAIRIDRLSESQSTVPVNLPIYPFEKDFVNFSHPSKHIRCE